MTAFIDWFESIPLIHRMCVAHIYRVCITESTTDMVMTPEQSLENFKTYFVRTDFPVRIAARMIMVSSVIHFILLNHQTLILNNFSLFPHDFSGQKNVELLAEHQWERTCESWKNLRRRELSDTYLNAWSRAVIAV